MRYWNKYLFNILCLTIMLIVSCSSMNGVESSDEKNCNENLEFKKVFFENVRNVEILIDKNQNESFKIVEKLYQKYL